MNKFVIAAAILLGCAAATLNAAGLTLGNLTAGGPVNSTDLFYDVQAVGSGGVKVTASQIKTFMSATPTFSGVATFSATAALAAATLSGISSTQCLQVSTSGVVSGVGVPCSLGAGTPGGLNTQVQFNNNGVLAGDSSFTVTTPGQVTMALGTVTTTTPKAVNISAIWNNSAVNFDAPFFMNVTNTASASGAILADIQVGTASIFQLQPGANGGGALTSLNLETPNGGIASQIALEFGGTISAPTYELLFGVAGGNADFFNDAVVGDTAFGPRAGSGRLLIGVGPTNSVIQITTDTLAQSRLANPQTFRLYNTIDVSSNPVNYERAAFDWSTSVNTLTIGTQSNGTGVGRVVMLVASGTKAISLSPTINLYGQSNPGANETYAVCAGSGATSLTAGGQLFVDTTACLASSILVKHDIAAFNDYGMTKLASLAEPLHARNRMANAPIDIDPIAKIMALVPAAATYDTLGSGGPEFTLIAQNVCQVDERLCERTRGGEVRTFKPNSVISILVAAIQKQQAEIDELKRRLH